jgi:hypothetical protein
MNLTVLRNTGQVFCKMSLSVEYSFKILSFLNVKSISELLWLTDPKQPEKGDV